MESGKLAMTEEEQGYVEAWNAALAFVKPMVIKSAIQLGIPDALYTKGPLTLEQIAEETSSRNTTLLFRILRFLVAHHIFSEIKDDDSCKYALTEASKWLVSSRKKTLAPYVRLLLHEEASLSPYFRLHGSVLGEENTKTGRLYEYLATNPSHSKLFNEAMAARSGASIDTIVKQETVFEGIKTLVDVGGGVGLVTSQIVAAFPFIRGINFDRPYVIANARAAPGVEHVAGDMFVEIPSGDAVLLKMVLHGYDDETCLKILSNCHKALSKDGKIIVVDYLLSEGDPAGYTADMIMAACSVSGRDRTQDEWQALLSSASFLRVKFHPRFLDSMCIIEAFK